MFRAFAIAALTAGLAALPMPAVAQDEAQPQGYLDDRSSAAAVIVSFYNAVARGELARAWSYWDETAAETDYQGFVDGFSGRSLEALVLGEATEEGAAGSIYSTLPVAVSYALSDGGTEVLAGCYTLRIAQPSIQEPPFRPLSIEGSTLAATEGAIEDALPESC